MRALIRNVGNLKGIMLPKSILSQCNIVKEVTIDVKNKKIIIKASSVSKRKGWGKAFKEMAEKGDDALAIPDIFVDEMLC